MKGTEHLNYSWILGELEQRKLVKQWLKPLLNQELNFQPPLSWQLIQLLTERLKLQIEL